MKRKPQLPFKRAHVCPNCKNDSMRLLSNGDICCNVCDRLQAMSWEPHPGSRR